jgi:hypothetical protein
MSYHCIPVVRMETSKRQKTTCDDNGVEKWEHFDTVGKNVK